MLLVQTDLMTVHVLNISSGYEFNTICGALSVGWLCLAVGLSAPPAEWDRNPSKCTQCTPETVVPLLHGGAAVAPISGVRCVDSRDEPWCSMGA